jgi:predicted Zn-dependent protease
MKRLTAAAIAAFSPTGHGNLTSAMPWAAFAILAAVAFLAALGGCAGAPKSREGALSPRTVAERYDEAGALLVEGTPESLEACAVRMSLTGLPQPASGQLAALAGSLFRLLYPELAVPAAFPPPAVYGGPYRAVLAQAARGLPPPPGWSPPTPEAPDASLEQTAADSRRSVRAAARRAAREAAEVPGSEEVAAAAEARLAGFLNRVVPALYLSRVEVGPGGEEAAPLDWEIGTGLEEARTDNPRSVMPPYLLARAAELSGRLEEAEGLYEECLELTDSFYPARERLAALYLADGRATRAADQMERLHAAFPDDPAMRDALIQAQLRAGDPQRASVLVAEALIEEPDSAALLLMRAETLLAQGNWAQALKPLGLLRLRHPEVPEGYLLAARIHQEQAEDLERALEVIGEAEERFPEDPRFPELAGSMLLAEDHSDEGLEQLKRAMELEPGRLSSLRLVAAESMRRHRWVLAGRTLEEILAREQTREDLLNAYTTATHLGDPQRVLEYAERLYRLQDGEQARLRYAEVLLGAGRVEEARRLVGGADRQEYESPQVRSSLLYLQARLLEEGDPDGALSLLQRAVAENPDNQAAVRRLAEVYLRRGQLRQARLFFRAAVELDPEDTGLALQLQEVERELEATGDEPPALTP